MACTLPVVAQLRRGYTTLVGMMLVELVSPSAQVRNNASRLDAGNVADITTTRQRRAFSQAISRSISPPV